MKYRFVFVIAVLSIVLVGCRVPENNNIQGSSPQVSQKMTIFSQNVSTIAPAEFVGASVVKTDLSTKALIDEEKSILSYISSDKIGFQPLVFESSNGTKIIFVDVELMNLGDGYSICEIGEIVSVKEEPEIIYEKAGIDEETGEIIYIPKEILVERTNYWGSNYAIFDFHEMEVYLLNDPLEYSSNSIIFEKRYIYASDNAIYLMISNGGEQAIYRVSKDAIEDGMIPMTNSRYHSSPQIEQATDETLIFAAWDEHSSFHTFIRHTDRDSAPVLFDLSKFTTEVKIDNTNNKYKVYPSNSTQVLDGSTIHCLYIVYGNLINIDILFTGDELIGGEVTTFKLSSSIAQDLYGKLNIIDKRTTSSGLEVIASSGNLLLRILFSDGNLSVEEVELTGDNAGAIDFATSDDRVYWISSAYTSKQNICYTDFRLPIVSKELMGKSVASSVINVLNDGSVVYTQFLNGTDTGTFSWNIDKEDSPRLLSTYNMDVKQVVNIDAL